MRLIFGLVLIYGVPAHAGVVYTLTHRNLDPQQTSPDLVLQNFVEADNVRVTTNDPRLVFIYKDSTLYAIDNTARTVSVQKIATRAQIEAQLAASIKKLEDSAADAQPENRASTEQMARQIRDTVEHQQKPVARDYRITPRSDSVDGHACRIWEEREKGSLRLELCVADAAKVFGGAAILRGMKALSEYWNGSPPALGVQFGPGPWWSGIAGLGGVPILIREFKDGAAIAETTLTQSHAEPTAALLDLPAGYQVQELPGEAH